jgi:hypothetical protein
MRWGIPLRTHPTASREEGEGVYDIAIEALLRGQGRRLANGTESSMAEPWAHQFWGADIRFQGNYLLEWARTGI